MRVGEETSQYPEGGGLIALFCCLGWIEALLQCSGLGWAETFLQFLSLELCWRKVSVHSHFLLSLKTSGGNFQRRNFQSLLLIAAISSASPLEVLPIIYLNTVFD